MKKLTVVLIAVFLFPASFALGGEHPAQSPLGDITPDSAVSELEFAFHSTPEFARPLDEYQMDETEGQYVFLGRVATWFGSLIAGTVLVDTSKALWSHYVTENPHAGSDMIPSTGGRGGLHSRYSYSGYYAFPLGVHPSDAVNSIDRALHQLGQTDEIPPNGIIR